MMRNALALCCALAAALPAAFPAAAQTVYRCGDSYSQQPCPSGKAIETPPAPGMREQQRAREAAARDARAADALEKTRLKEESRPVSAYIPPKKEDTPEPVQAPTMDKPGKPHLFTAAVPGEKKAKKKAAKKAGKKKSKAKA